MKKLTITVILVGFISLGFTAVNNAPEIKEIVKTSEQLHYSGNWDEKRLACWD